MRLVNKGQSHDADGRTIIGYLPHILYLLFNICTVHGYSPCYIYYFVIHVINDKKVR